MSSSSKLYKPVGSYLLGITMVDTKFSEFDSLVEKDICVRGRGPAKDITETELAYFAGFFDGEGCVLIARFKRHDKKEEYYYGLDCTVVQTNPTPLNALRDAFGGCIQKRRGCALYGWSIRSRMAESFLRSICKYLIVKKEEALLGIAFAEKAVSIRDTHNISLDYYGRQRGYYLEMKGLKHRKYDEHGNVTDKTEVDKVRGV